MNTLASDLQNRIMGAAHTIFGNNPDGETMGNMGNGNPRSYTNGQGGMGLTFEQVHTFLKQLSSMREDDKAARH